MNKCPIEKYFHDNRLTLDKVSEHWTPGLLLGQTGLFALEEIAALLDVQTARIKLAVDTAQRAGRNAWNEVGVRCLLGRWVVWMDVFSSYYLGHFYGDTRAVPSTWDANYMLTQKGVFYLNDVCRLLPFTPTMLRYQASKSPDLARVMGIWKKDQCYVVDMAVFGPWLQAFWLKVKGQ